MKSMVEVLQIVGESLAKEYGAACIPSARIRYEVEKIRGRKPGNGCPADLCYNIRKFGMRFPNTPMFEQLASAEYKYLGLNYPYTGIVTHQPRGSARLVVGRWEKGVYLEAGGA